MTDEEIREKYKDIPTSKIIKRLFVLLGKLIIAIICQGLRYILKGIVWCVERCGDGVKALKDFWQSSDTQEKKKKILTSIKSGSITFWQWCCIAFAWTKKYTIIGAKLAWKYTVIGAKLFIKYSIIACIRLWKGFLWTIQTIKDLIIHSKPTFIRLGKSIKNGCISLWHFLVRVARGIKLGHIRRRRAWQHFRRTKGFKGLLIDMGKSLSNGVKSFMEEEQTDTNPDAITEDDIIAEEIEERQGTANKIGQKFFKGMKNIVEEK